MDRSVVVLKMCKQENGWFCNIITYWTKRTTLWGNQKSFFPTFLNEDSICWESSDEIEDNESDDEDDDRTKINLC